MERELAKQLAFGLGSVFAMAMANEHKKASELLRDIRSQIQSDADIDAVANEAWAMNLTMFNSAEKIKHHLGIKGE